MDELLKRQTSDTMELTDYLLGFSSRFGGEVEPEAEIPAIPATEQDLIEVMK